jgi:hypothetical protein
MIIHSLLSVLPYFLYPLIKNFTQLTYPLIFLHLKKLLQFYISFKYIKFYIRLQFPQTYHTHLHWFVTAFLQMITAIHQTFIKYTMSQPKHMCYFMSHHSHRSILYQIVINLVFSQLKKSLVIPSK